MWRDLWVGNFVDLDPTNGTRAWNCSKYAYDGHTGHDSALSGFKEQDIGVPIFAALDGTVAYTHDGEPDKNTETKGQPGNEVMIDHGGGHKSWYVHLKKGSVAVEEGQFVRAGTQLGLTGSSGNSTWPHLHFESVFDGEVYEPSAGECRPGPSYWTSQSAIPSRPTIRSVIFSYEEFDGRRQLPWDEVSRMGTLVSGNGLFNIRVELAHVPKQSRFRFSFVNPSGEVVPSFGGAFKNEQTLRTGWYWWGLGIDTSTRGTWRVRLRINKKQVLNAPMDVVPNKAAIHNRPPQPIVARLRTTGDGIDDVLLCEVMKPTLVRDLDYDLVKYDYGWTVDGESVRSVTSAGLADVLAARTAEAGQEVACSITPSDHTSKGQTATVTLR
jgi:hypothetical protein